MSRLTNIWAAIWISVVAIILYIIIYHAVGRDDAKFIADLLLLIFSTVMVVTVFVPAVEAIKRGAHSGSDKWLLSFFGAWCMILLQRFYIILVNSFDMPGWFSSGPLAGIIAILFTIAAGYGIAAPVAGVVQLSKHQITTLIIAAIMGGLIGGMAVGIRITIGWI